MSATTAPESARRRGPKTPKSCHERALGLLAVRPRSRRELEGRLTAAGFASEEVADVLERLEHVGLIDDAEFARAVAEQQFVHRRAGRRAVVSALMSKGVARDLIEAAVADAGEGQDEDERALELARSRVGRLSGMEATKAFGRLSSFLMRRGYPPETARQAARSALLVVNEED